MLLSKFRMESDHSYTGVMFSEQSEVIDVYCPNASKLWVVCKKIKLCYLLFSISVVIGQFSSKWPGLGSRTVMSGDRMQKKKLLVNVEIAIFGKQKIGLRCFANISKTNSCDLTVS